MGGGGGGALGGSVGGGGVQVGQFGVVGPPCCPSFIVPFRLPAVPCCCTHFQMSTMLGTLKPNLLTNAEETEALIKTMKKESSDAEAVRLVVADEEALCDKKAADAKVIKDQCEEKLQEVLPALDAATKAVSQISKKELAEIRSLQTPSDKIKRVIEAVCVCLEEQPKRSVDTNGKVSYDYWEVAKKKVMADTTTFIDRLLNYDKVCGAIPPPPPCNPPPPELRLCVWCNPPLLNYDCVCGAIPPS